MVWWLVKECFAVMIRPLWLTAPSGRCVVVKFCNIVSYLLIFTNHRRFKHGVVVSGRVFFCNDRTIMAYCMLHLVGACVPVKFCTIVSYLLIFTNHCRFKHGVVVNEKVFFSNDKTITAYYSICSCEILHCCKLFVNNH